MRRPNGASFLVTAAHPIPAPVPVPARTTLNFAQRPGAYAQMPAPRAADAASLQTLQGETMGTVWRLRWVNTDMRPIAPVQALVQDQLDLVIAQMSNWEPDAFISRFNAAPAGAVFAMPPEFAQVLRAGLGWAECTHGAFDPAAGQLVALWGFGPHAAKSLPPSPAALAALRGQANWRTLGVLPTADPLIQPGALWLDFSGIAKGYAVDRVAQALKAAGIANFLIDIGGELRAAGRRPDGTSWHIQLDVGEASPHAANDAPVLALNDMAVATSGSRWHQHTQGGQQWSHTIDPRTGQASASPLRAVTVLHAACMDADALATALWVLGPHDGLALADALNVAARLHGLNGEVLHSQRWADSGFPIA